MTEDGVRKVISFANMSPGRQFDSQCLALSTRINRNWAWTGGDGGRVRVCILDSGLRPDFQPEVVDARLTVRRADADGSWEIVNDDQGDAANHGSDCAEIIHRLAPAARITSIRVLGAGLGGSSRTLVEALSWAIEQKFAVVNLSLSTKNTVAKHELHDLADRAVFGNVALVAAANNNAVDSFPWRFSSVFSTGSHDFAESEYLEVNPCPPVEFFARGVRVPVPRGESTALVSGNSFAAPHLSGLIARIRSKHPRLSLMEVRHVLFAVSDNIGEAIA